VPKSSEKTTISCLGNERPAVITEKEIVDKLTTSVTENVAALIQDSLSEIVQREISKALAAALFEGEFHRGVSSEVFTGIENIFRELSSFKKNLNASTSQGSSGQEDPKEGLLDGSTSVLDDIISSTEKATLNILDCLDQMQLLIQNARESAQNGNGASDQASAIEGIESIIMTILTELSFQDLTGQQIRMVIRSLKRVEELVYEVYLMAEALRKTKEKSPEKDIAVIKEEAKVLVCDFKERKDVIDQSEIDALFEQVGL